MDSAQNLFNLDFSNCIVCRSQNFLGIVYICNQYPAVATQSYIPKVHQCNRQQLHGIRLISSSTTKTGEENVLFQLNVTVNS